MATPVILPKLGMTMEDATILRWVKQEGETVSKDEPLLEIMTDKVEMQVEAPAAGVLRGIRVQPGEVVPVAQIIAYIVAAGEPLPAEMPPITRSPAVSVTPAPSVSRPVGPPASKGDVVAATPAARRVAREIALDLSKVTGTGPGGSITEADVRAALARPERTPAATADRRRAVAGRLLADTRGIPHIYLRRAVDLSSAVVRGQASYTAITVWAAARALHAYPVLRSSFDGEAVIVHDAIHIGVVVDAPEAWLVPVVRDANRKSFLAIHRELEDLAQRARGHDLTPAETSDGVFTVANLGMFGVDQFSIAPAPPQVGMLAVGAVRPRPWAVGDSVKVRPICELTLALDHRIVDGVTGARFFDDVCRRLEAIEEGF